MVVRVGHAAPGDRRVINGQNVLARHLAWSGTRHPHRLARYIGQSVDIADGVQHGLVPGDGKSQNALTALGARDDDEVILAVVLHHVHGHLGRIEILRQLFLHRRTCLGYRLAGHVNVTISAQVHHAVGLHRINPIHLLDACRSRQLDGHARLFQSHLQFPSDFCGGLIDGHPHHANRIVLRTETHDPLGFHEEVTANRLIGNRSAGVDHQYVVYSNVIRRPGNHLDPFDHQQIGRFDPVDRQRHLR